MIAWTGELDHWRNCLVDRPLWWVSLRFWRSLGSTAVFLLTAAAVAGAVLGWLRSRAGPPVRLALDHVTLIVSDEKGREIWRRTFDEPFVRGLTASEWFHYRFAAFADVNGDGRTELLFVYRPADYATRGDTLFCFSPRGQELWRYQVRRTVSSPGETFPPPYLASFILPLPPSRDGTRRIVYVSHHVSYYPAQVALLSASGELLAEYWHSGHLPFGEVVQLEGRRNPALLLAGISNSHRTCTLVALDPDSPWCASDESEHPGYQLSLPLRDCELARLLFPRTCISRRLDPYSAPLGLVVHPEFIRFGTGELSGDRPVATIFRFDRLLNLLSAEVTDAFVARHRRLEAEGQLDHTFSEAEVRALRQIRVLRHWKLPSASSPSSLTSEARAQ
ncbi:MAG: hypothetical protein N2036_16255 [Bryobacteraceae bacterium]|nr:hypothetical protein [Bryobacteraceae bacterium]